MTDGAGISGTVDIVGVGLLGTSVALACRRAGLDVVLSDIEADHVRTATALGAGRPRVDSDSPAIVVIAVPPDHLGEAIVAALDRTAGTDAVVTDVGSVKNAPLTAVLSHAERARYVGSHPMAGNERSGPLAASAALFDGRPWAVTPHEDALPHAVSRVRALATACGGAVVELDPLQHDRAVALVSHMPHLMSALTAGRLADAPSEHVALAGQGVRDVTRVAAGDPTLYSQIVDGNASAVSELLLMVRDALDDLLAAISAGDRVALEEVLRLGARGTRAIPAKHGGPTVELRSIYVAIPDAPGSLAKLFADAGDIGVNIEDVRIDHDQARNVGVVELAVDTTLADGLLSALEGRGWVAHR